MNITDLRLECLRLAIRDGEHHEIVVKAAEAYVAFVEKGDHTLTPMETAPTGVG